MYYIMIFISVSFNASNSLSITHISVKKSIYQIVYNILHLFHQCIHQCIDQCIQSYQSVFISVFFNASKSLSIITCISESINIANGVLFNQCNHNCLDQYSYQYVHQKNCHKSLNQFTQQFINFSFKHCINQ